MKKLLPIFLLIFTAVAYGQADLPEMGKLTDIEGKTKIYIVASAEARKAMSNKLAKDMPSLTIVTSPKDAEFFLEYVTSSRKTVSLAEISLETGQVDAYFYNDAKIKVVAWSESGTGGGFGGDAAGKITSKFIKAFKKVDK